MHIFKDSAGRSWTLEINVWTIKRIKAATGVNLPSLTGDGFKPLADLVADPIGLCDVLYAAVQDQATRDKINEEQFLRAMAGDCLGAAGEVFVEELIDFFQDSRAREALRKVLATARTMRERMLDHLEQKLATIDPTIEADKLIASSGSAPASSE